MFPNSNIPIQNSNYFDLRMILTWSTTKTHPNNIMKYKKQECQQGMIQ
jgi:hypothetical protein